MGCSKVKFWAAFFVCKSGVLDLLILLYLRGGVELYCGVIAGDFFCILICWFLQHVVGTEGTCTSNCIEIFRVFLTCLWGVKCYYLGPRNFRKSWARNSKQNNFLRANF